MPQNGHGKRDNRMLLPVPDPKEFRKEFGSDSPTVVSEVPHT